LKSVKTRLSEAPQPTIRQSGERNLLLLDHTSNLCRQGKTRVRREVA